VKQYSIAHLTLLHLAPPELVEVAARTGYEFVGLRLIPVGYAGEPLYPVATNRALFERTRAALKSTGIKVLDIELARIHAGVNVRDYVPALEAAAELGARHVTTGGWCKDRQFVLERFTELCDLARPLGLSVDFEPVTFCDFPTLADAVAVVKSAQRDNAAILIDTLHFDRSGNRLDEIEALPASYFRFIQVCDGPKLFGRSTDELKFVAREARLMPGEGGIDIAGILQRLPEVPYSLEIPHARRLAELGDEEFARRCLQTTRRYLGDRQLN
jgi:sugar phosphate isomerase/epimerase